MTSSHHGPYVQGYTRATMGCTEGSEAARWSGTQKATRSPDWSPLVIANQNVAVNTFPGLVHTARHTMGVNCTRSSLLNPQGRAITTVWFMTGVKS